MGWAADVKLDWPLKMSYRKIKLYEICKTELTVVFASSFTERDSRLRLRPSLGREALPFICVGVHTNSCEFRTRTDLGYILPVPFEKARPSFFDSCFCPYGQCIRIPRNGDGQKFGPESFAAVTTVVTGDNKCATCTKVLCFILLLQSEGSREVVFRDLIRRFFINTKRDKPKRKGSRRGERVFWDE